MKMKIFYSTVIGVLLAAVLAIAGPIAELDWPDSLPARVFSSIRHGPLYNLLRQETREAKAHLSTATQQGYDDAMQAPKTLLARYEAKLHAQAQLGKNIMFAMAENEVEGAEQQALRGAYWEGFAKGLSERMDLYVTTYGCGSGTCTLTFFW